MHLGTDVMNQTEEKSHSDQDISETIGIIESFMEMRKILPCERTPHRARWIVRGMEFRVEWQSYRRVIIMTFPTQMKDGVFRNTSRIQDLDRYRDRIESWVMRNVMTVR